MYAIRSYYEIAEYGKVLALVYETLYQDIDPLELDNETQRLKVNLVSQYVRMQKRVITQQLQTAEGKEVDELLGRVRDLDILLRTEKEGSGRGTDVITSYSIHYTKLYEPPATFATVNQP